MRLVGFARCIVGNSSGHKQVSAIAHVELLNMAAGGLEQLGQFGCLHISRNGALERQVGAKRLAGAWMGSRRGIIAVVVPAATV